MVSVFESVVQSCRSVMIGDEGVGGCGWRRQCRARVVAVVLSAAAVGSAGAGPWSALPDAIDDLVADPRDVAAEKILVAAEASMMLQAEDGRLVAADSLFDTYASLVSRLPGGPFRLRLIGQRLAAALLEAGDELATSDPRRAAAIWAFAGELDSGSAAVDRLRRMLFPPVNAEAGQLWKAPLDGATLVYHPAAAIRMGCTDNDGECRDNEVYFRWVEIPARWFEAFEVTNRRYRQCVQAGACTTPEDPSAFDDRARADDPVVGVSWRQARSYARWAGRRLPSEAEWERAARGEVTDARFPWGNKRHREYANVWLDPSSAIRGGTRPVGSYPTMGYGMKDMSGNVWEWCADRYRPRFSDASDNGGAARDGWGRVVRGGSWRRAVDMARVSTRSWYEVGYAADDVGFRCVVDHQPQVGADEVVRIAQRAFASPTAPGREFAGAQLEAEDRRYLERRRLTLFVIEGRTGEALVPAARRLVVERDDPVAGEIFVRFEAEIARAAAAGECDEVRRGLARYRAAVDEVPAITGRLAGFQRRLVGVLRAAIEEFVSAGDRKRVRGLATVGIEIVGEDEEFKAAAARAARPAGSSRVWPGDGKGMVWLPGGTFKMGAPPAEVSAPDNERPPHRVAVEGFWLDRTEVTNEEYRSCVNDGACTPPRRRGEFDNPRLGNHPVLGVDWFQAREYAAWAGKRLPTEAEWEFAARGGAATAYPWGADWVPGRANSLGTHREDLWVSTAPVATFPPRTWGLYDLVGNVAEWVEDVYNDSYSGAPGNGRAWYQETGLASERRRVVRGGGWDDPPQRQRVTKRNGRRPVRFNRSVGFRCAVDD